MIAKIAVSKANFAIDKSYSYFIPPEMELQPGIRVAVPFGRGNRVCEGIVLQVEEGRQQDLKPVLQKLDETPVLSHTMLQLASFMRQRYFCTFYDAAHAMLPAGLWFRTKDTYALTEDRSWQDAAIRQPDAKKLLQFLSDCGGQTDGSALQALLEPEAFEKAVNYLLRKKWITAQRDMLQRQNEKVELIATLCVPDTEALEYASRRPKSALMQKSVLETLCAVGSASVKELC